MKAVFLTAVLACAALSAIAQRTFERHWTFNNWSAGERVLEVPGSGYYTIGWNDSLSFDSLGQPQIDYFEGLVTHFDYDGNAIKAFRYGNDDTLFNRLFGGNSDDSFITGVVDSNNRLFLAGWTQSYGVQSFYDYDFWLVKLDTNFNIILNRNISIPDTAYAMYNTVGISNPQNGITLCGYLKSLTNFIPYAHISAFDSSGNLLFRGMPLPNEPSELQGIVSTSDGGYLCSGVKYNNYFSGDISPLVVKTDSIGREVWRLVLPYSNDYHFAGDLTATQDGNYVFTWGNVYRSPGATNKVWMYHASKVDEAGNILWTRDYTYSFNSRIRISEVPNGRLMISGLFTDTLTFGDAALLILCDQDGYPLWTRTFIGEPGTSPAPMPFCMDANFSSDGGFLLTGQTSCCNFTPNLGWTSSLWLLKTDSLGLITQVSSGPNNYSNDVHLGFPFPNPVADYCSIPVTLAPDIGQAQLLLFDLQGRQVACFPLQSGFQQLQLDLSPYPAGEYLLALSINGFNAGARRLVVGR